MPHEPVSVFAGRDRRVHREYSSRRQVLAEEVLSVVAGEGTHGGDEPVVDLPAVPVSFHAPSEHVVVVGAFR